VRILHDLLRQGLGRTKLLALTRVPRGKRGG
jgi:hypothetical protein